MKEIYEIASADKSQFYETQFHNFLWTLERVCVCVVREKAMQKNIEKKTERETTTVTMQ